MLAEDVGLLPDARDGGGSFLQMLRTYREEPDTLRHMLRIFWQAMDAGGFNAAIAKTVLRFNGTAGLRRAPGAADRDRAAARRLGGRPGRGCPARGDAATLDKDKPTKAEQKKREELLAEAVAELRRFHNKLCKVRVLDPACGSGNSFM